MKNLFKTLTVGITTLTLCLTINNFASAKSDTGLNVAVIDVQQVVENSPRLTALKVEQKNKFTDLTKFIENAKNDLAKQTDDTKKKKLEENYVKELNLKKTEIEKNYTKKMAEIDKDINKIIKEKSVDYDLILTKNATLKGGTDITSEIIKSLK